MSDTPSFKEDAISQIPALHLLQNLGYTYLPASRALALRGGKRGNMILDGVLEEQLRKINKVRFKGEEFAFTEGNIQAAMQTLKDVVFDGLVRTNEKIYDLLCLGKSMQQTILGDTKSFPLHYIDWKTPANNVFHVTAEFVVERTGSHELLRPDIVLFVNGIPLGVIECKSPLVKDAIEQAISQQVRNQKDEYIPRLFQYSQLLLAVSKNEAKYATAGTAAKFWAVWKERGSDETTLQAAIAKPLTQVQLDTLFSECFKDLRNDFEALARGGTRAITEQDRAIFGLGRPERLLEMMFRYTLFDAGEKKIARYQQYFCVRNIIERIAHLDKGSRLGGVVWHTQGSGKSLTMVMLANAIAMMPGVDDYKIVLVTDRIDLDDQLYKTFSHCGTEPEQAKSGKDLSKLLDGQKARIITTIIDKFDAAVGKQAIVNKSPNIFVLVDEGHRGQYGDLHMKMRKVLPNACFIGFTGTPVLKKEKDTIKKFGGLIDTYTITQAVADKAVVPLLYEGRHVDQKVDKESIDSWFAKLTSTLTREQLADLKKKYATTDQLNKAQQKVMRIAWDISAHFRDNWQNTPYKAQLVTQDKSTALLYKKFLDEFGIVSSEVLISGPDEREGHEEVEESDPDAIQAFWKRMMTKYGNEKTYNKQLINAFKNGDDPEIIIVVDKLLTGFDAPRNTVLYLTRMLKDHTLLQAIARVNRLCEGKEFGYIIDYRGVLQNLDNALDMYNKLTDYEKEDLGGTLTHVSEEIKKLPQRHSDLLDIFKTIKNKRDEEEYEVFLGDDAERARFYERLSIYARTLSVALSTQSFHDDTPEAKIAKYKADLKFFMNLRTSVRRRYAETIDFKEYEGRIQKLIDAHVGTGEVEKITDLVNIFDADAFAKEVDKLDSTASKADTIAHRTKRTISERMQEDPAFYRRFSDMLEDAIRAFREKRLSDADYLKRVTEIQSSVRDRSGDDLPPVLKNKDVAKAFYGIVAEKYAKHKKCGFDSNAAAADTALRIDEIVQENRIVNWADNVDIQNRMKTEIEDYIFDLTNKHSISLALEDIDEILEKCLEVARVRYP